MMMIIIKNIIKINLIYIYILYLFATNRILKALYIVIK